MEKQKNIDYMEAMFQKVADKVGENSQMAQMFRQCYQNTLQTTMQRVEDGTTYAITGDIPAMWLRDSSAQIRPCLFQAKEDGELLQLIAGLIKRQFFYIHIDAYTNAFNKEANGACWEKDETDLVEENPFIWERKYEIDSLCYPVQLAWLLWKNTGYQEQFTEEVRQAFIKIMDVFETEQYHEEKSNYRFVRRNSFFQDTLSRDGKGSLVKDGIGLTWSGFRPSDDACVYGYLIPSNMFAVVILGYMEEVLRVIYQEEEQASRACILKETIRTGIETFGVTKKEGFGEIYAYEVDGFGQYQLMDDANIPSLLSMHYLGYQAKTQTAQNTRAFILSEANPYYFQGEKAAGIGSLHTPAKHIWPIALAMEGLTADRTRQKEILDILMDTHGGTNLMHESFHTEDDTIYTRPWFSWANAMFCELVLSYCGLELQIK